MPLTPAIKTARLDRVQKIRGALAVEMPGKNVTTKPDDFNFITVVDKNNDEAQFDVILHWEAEQDKIYRVECRAAYSLGVRKINLKYKNMFTLATQIDTGFAKRVMDAAVAYQEKRQRNEARSNQRQSNMVALKASLARGLEFDSNYGYDTIKGFDGGVEALLRSSKHPTTGELQYSLTFTNLTKPWELWSLLNTAADLPLGTDGTK